MKTIATTTTTTTTLHNLSNVQVIENQTVWFTYGRTEYQLQGTYKDSSCILIIGKKDKEYKTFDALKNAEKEVKVTIKTITSLKQEGVDEIELITPNEESYSFKDLPLKGSELKVGCLYADIFYHNACVMELVSMTDNDLEFRAVYGNSYGPEMVIAIDSGDWYAVNEPDAHPSLVG